MSDATNDINKRLQMIEEELARSRLTLEVVGTMDLDAGVLNRNGLLEAIERARRWLDRRGDLFGLVVVWFPRIALPDENASRVELLRHIAATLAAGVREVDELARIDQETFATTLCDVRPDSTSVVAGRIEQLATALADGTPELGGDARVAALEVRSTQVTSPGLLDEALALVRASQAGAPAIDLLL